MSLILQREIRHLVTRFDRIVTEQAGPRVFAPVRRLRQLAERAYRAGSARSWSRQQELVDRLDLATAHRVAHAFSLYFLLVNLCEERARERHLRSHRRPAMSLRSVFHELARAGVPPARLQRCLDRLEIQPVLTAHPTEAKRRTVLNHITRLRARWDDPDEVLETLWQTEEIREQKVGPLDEVDHTLYFFDRTIIATVPAFYATFDAELARHFPSVRRRHAFLTVGSWVGGDRDGNPFVTPAVSREAAARHHATIRGFYLRECALLEEELTQAAPDQDLDRPHDLPVRPRRLQPYEVIRGRVARLRHRLETGRCDATAFVAALTAIRDDLARQGAARAARGRIARLLTQAETFGWHLATLDFREHSGRIESDPGAVRAQMQEIRRIQRRYGRSAAQRYILSMTRQAGDLLALLRLARRSGLEAVDLVPLFETISDLERAPATMARLWADPRYRRHLRRRGDVQEVMVGYSDSNKDGGYLAANWFLQRTQRQLAQLADRAGIHLRFFHGKGGTIDRGGGASYRSLRSQPDAAHGGRLRVTEQGEVVSLKYSNPVIAQRNWEQLTSAVIASTCLPKGSGRDRRRFEAWTERLAQLSLGHYRRLVFETPAFADYFWQATPIDLIEHLRLGSRPARRSPGQDIRQLRAIPWVFAWTQSRHLLPAWYGVGHALAAFARERDGLDRLSEMYRASPSFRALIDNVEASLAKTDLGIARLYAGLVPSAEVRSGIFGLIEAEYRRAVSGVLAVTGHAELLETQPVLARSIRRRNPYLAPLNHLQIRFLRQWREAAPADRTERLRRLLALTVQGLAAAMKSTG
ncbi:MAG TPA: phosphoenolpyruvate carboxylase [Lacunisphaera sp.]|nr:phosphoenolpyruvate carboxylase [Lacunisphaera sp.]